MRVEVLLTEPRWVALPATHPLAGQQLWDEPFIVAPAQTGSWRDYWPPANDTNPVVQDFVRCCLDHKPAG